MKFVIGDHLWSADIAAEQIVRALEIIVHPGNGSKSIKILMKSNLSNIRGFANALRGVL